MTAYELSDLIASAISNQIMVFTVFLTLISAYLIAAFAVGRNLTSIQVTIHNGVFVLAAASNGLSMFRASVRVIELTDEAVRREIIEFTEPRAYAPALVLACYALVVLVSFVFMWNSRRSSAP
jgi:hypothetical protein